MSRLLNLPGLASQISDEDRVPVIDMTTGQEGTVTIAEFMGTYVLSEVQEFVTLSATGSAAIGACEFGGFVVRSQSGGTADITIYDALSATGTPIMTVSNVVNGVYFWLGDHATAGVGRAGRRLNATGCWVVISGTATLDVMVA